MFHHDDPLVSEGSFTRGVRVAGFVDLFECEFSRRVLLVRRGCSFDRVFPLLLPEPRASAGLHRFVIGMT